MQEFKKDLLWWLEFFKKLNGISFFLIPSLHPSPAVVVGLDASGSLGFGAFLESEWFNGRWLPQQASLSIAYKELFPVVLSTHVRGHRWGRQHILFRVDNESVVAVLNSRTSRDTAIMHLLRSLLQVAAQFAFSFAAEYVAGVNNGIADALSRFHLPTDVQVPGSQCQQAPNTDSCSAAVLPYSSSIDSRCLFIYQRA